jgi:hypothetical protein
VSTNKGTRPFQYVLNCIWTHQNYNITTADRTLDLELQGTVPKVITTSEQRQKQLVDCFDVLLRAEWRNINSGKSFWCEVEVWMLELKANKGRYLSLGNRHNEDEFPTHDEYACINNSVTQTLYYATVPRATCASWRTWHRFRDNVSLPFQFPLPPVYLFMRR